MRSPIRITTLSLVSLAAALTACSSPSTQEAAPPVAPTVVATPFAGEVGQGISYLQTRGADLLEATESLLVAIEARNLEAARKAYFAARAPYEEIEVVARAFPELHERIDARAHEYPSGELDPNFGGFHRIETFLFSRSKTQPALSYAKQLVEDVEDLQMVLSERGRFGAALSFDSMIDRCSDIAARTITSEEEIWSDQSLTVIRHAWIGIHSQYRHFAGDVRKEDVKLAERLNRSYRSAMELIASDFPIGQVTGTPYSLVNRDKRRKIADESIKLRGFLVKAQETLGLVDA